MEGPLSPTPHQPGLAIPGQQGREHPRGEEGEGVLAGPLVPAVSGDVSRAASRPLRAAQSSRAAAAQHGAHPERGCAPRTIALRTSTLSGSQEIPSPAAATSDRGKHPKQGLQLQTLACAAFVPISPLCNNPTFSQPRLSIAQSKADVTLLRASKERQDIIKVLTLATNTA